jgi:serine protease AprX
MNLSSAGKTRKKAVWGRKTLIACFIAMFAAVSVPALAGPGNGKTPHKKQQHQKLDRQLNELADSVGETDVIVEFHDDSDSTIRITASGGRAGRKLGIIKSRAARISNVLLKRLADDPKVKRIVRDREVEGEIARTAATVGARNVHGQYGYTGAGIGVAVIDSGITAWHDDLTVANRQGQRVTKFVDFINGRTQKYDDWGHGTHVAGIIAGNGYDSAGARLSIAPKANIVALKALDHEGKGRISDIIAALDWVVTNRVQYNIRVVNMSLGAGVFESYNTDPLTVAAKRAVDAGIVVVAAAGNMGKAANGQPQYGAIPAPGNAPWVLTVGASSTQGTTDRRDDVMAQYSSRGPTMIDFAAKPDLVAPGSGSVSLSVPGSTMYTTKAAYLVAGKLNLGLTSLPYLTLSGTSMAAPVVAGTVALMLEANPSLTPNLVKAMLQYTAQVYTGYDYLTQGAGFVNTLGAVRLARFFAVGEKGDHYPNMKAWSRHILWGNRRVSGGVLTPGGTAWLSGVQWGGDATPAGANIVWGENCDGDCDNIVWGNNIVWGESDGDDNIVWGNTDGDNIVWGNSDDDNIVWGNGDDDNIVWGNDGDDNIVWGNDCAGADCDNIVWGNDDDGDNIVWGNAEGIDNIVWGNSDGGDENIVWGNSSVENISWGSAADEAADLFGDDTAEYESFDPTVWESLFDVPLITSTTTTSTGGAQ